MRRVMILQRASVRSILLTTCSSIAPHHGARVSLRHRPILDVNKYPNPFTLIWRGPIFPHFQDITVIQRSFLRCVPKCPVNGLGHPVEISEMY